MGRTTGIHDDDSLVSLGKGEASGGEVATEVIWGIGRPSSSEYSAQVGGRDSGAFLDVAASGRKVGNPGNGGEVVVPKHPLGGGVALLGEGPVNRPRFRDRWWRQVEFGRSEDGNLFAATVIMTKVGDLAVIPHESIDNMRMRPSGLPVKNSTSWLIAHIELGFEMAKEG